MQLTELDRNLVMVEIRYQNREKASHIPRKNDGLTGRGGFDFGRRVGNAKSGNGGEGTNGVNGEDSPKWTWPFSVQVLYDPRGKQPLFEPQLGILYSPPPSRTGISLDFYDVFSISTTLFRIYDTPD